MKESREKNPIRNQKCWLQALTLTLPVCEMGTTLSYL